MVVEASNLMKNFQETKLIEWNPQLIHQLKSISNPISRAIDFWVDNILEEYIIEFYVDTITS